MVGSIGSVGAVRLSAWIWGFSSTANTAAATGGFMYSPTRSRTFSTRSGSGETLKLSCRHGLSPKARQISSTVVWLIPCLAARPRVDQCVASGGADSRVSTTTASITSSPIVRAAPGRGASTSPSRRSAAKRCRHLPTVTGLQPSSAAISAWVRPSAQASTIRDRNANACDDECRRAQRSQRRALLGAQDDLDGRASSTGHGCSSDVGVQHRTNAARTRKFPISQYFLADQPSRTLADQRGRDQVPKQIVAAPSRVDDGDLPSGTQSGPSIWVDLLEGVVDGFGAGCAADVGDWHKAADRDWDHGIA